MLELLLLAWLPLTIVVLIGAHSRRRSVFGYLVLSVLLTPFISAAALVLIKDQTRSMVPTGPDPYPVAPYEFHASDRRMLMTIAVVSVFALTLWYVVTTFGR